MREGSAGAGGRWEGCGRGTGGSGELSQPGAAELSRGLQRNQPPCSRCCLSEPRGPFLCRPVPTQSPHGPSAQHPEVLALGSCQASPVCPGSPHVNRETGLRRSRCQPCLSKWGPGKGLGGTLRCPRLTLDRRPSQGHEGTSSPRALLGPLDDL